MSLENLTGTTKYISALDPTNPVGVDTKDQGDDHIRGIKNTLRNTFPNINSSINATDEEINFSVGVTSAIQTQIDAAANASAANANAIASITTVPVAAVMPFASSSVPAEWLECNGTAVSRTTYATLFAAIGTTYGAGDGSTTFQLPDLRGEFIRGYDNGRGIDANRVLGSSQLDEFKAHSHTNVGFNNYIGLLQYPGFSGAGDGYNRVNSGTSGGAETRPRNIAMMYCIKY